MPRRSDGFYHKFTNHEEKIVVKTEDTASVTLLGRKVHWIMEKWHSKLSSLLQTRTYFTLCFRSHLLASPRQTNQRSNNTWTVACVWWLYMELSWTSKLKICFHLFSFALLPTHIYSNTQLLYRIFLLRKMRTNNWEPAMHYYFYKSNTTAKILGNR